MSVHYAVPATITKRDGREVAFDPDRISNALSKCYSTLGKPPAVPIAELTQRVVNLVSARHPKPSIEGVQDAVESVLCSAGDYEACKHYILYRNERMKMREERPIPDDVRQKFAESAQYFPTPIQMFQFFDKYSRFNYSLHRRETWVETVDRSVDFLRELAGGRLNESVFMRIRKAILNMDAMPSMRLLAMAGDAARRNNICIYNCSFVNVDCIDAFVEALIISMNGCGVGYSVERECVEQFPRVKRQKKTKPVPFVVPDTTEGWAEVIRNALTLWFDGYDIDPDYSHIRPAGTPLKTKGGRASGPGPLRDAINAIRRIVLSCQGGYLRSLDAHDIMCHIGNAAVCGGMRRTAMISLFDFDDVAMRHCKDSIGNGVNEQRWNANNSAVWPDNDLTQQEIADIMLDMTRSMRGEPGIFNRRSCTNTIPARRKKVRFGTNPCGEIILRSGQFCNLSVAVARQADTLETLKEKVEIATIIGTIQSMATNFPGLRPHWKKNCEEERLLGVDINGQMDCPVSRDPAVQKILRDHSVQINRTYAGMLEINQSASVTCVKPSGNSSVLLDCSPGIHSRWASYYIRNIRVAKHSALYKILHDSGVEMHPENGQVADTATTWVVHFPVKAPEGAITRNDLSALAQCNYWLQCKQNWTEHNPSVTITYRPNEILDITKWVWENRDVIGGMTFYPVDDAGYEQPPYEEINQKRYEELAAAFPEIDFSKLYRYELEDHTTAAQEVACLGGACVLQ